MATLYINGRFLQAPLTGVQRVAAELATAIHRRRPQNWPVEILCPQGPRRALAMPPGAVRSVGRLSGQLWEQVDLPFHARGGFLLSLANVAPLFSGPGLLLIHDSQVHDTPQSYSRAFRTWYRIAQPRMAARASFVVTGSEFSRARLAATGVCRVEKTHVVRHGAEHFSRLTPDLSAPERYGLGAGRYVVAMATLQAHKNLRVVAHAFADPLLKPIRLVLIGRGDRKTWLESGAPLPETALFTGPIDDAGFAGLLQGAMCFTFPSRTEGFGLPPLEALSVGCPVIAAPSGAVVENCGDAVDYADFDEPSTWVAAIQRIVNEPPGDRALRVQRGRIHAAKYRWDDSADALIALIRETLAR